MKKTDINRVISKSSVRQKIKLYFTDVALYNTYGENKRILTDEQRLICYNSIKEPKDIKYYDELRTWNKVYLLQLPILNNNVNQLRLTSTIIIYQCLILTKDSIASDFFNYSKIKDILKTDFTEDETKAIFSPKDYRPFIIELSNSFYTDIEIAINNISIMRELLKKLPLKAYKEEIKKIENTIKKKIEETNESLLNTLPEFNDKDKDKIKISNWEDIDPEEEDIEDLKYLGL